MEIFEFLWPVGLLFGISRFVYDVRKRIYNFLIKSKIGMWIMAPIIVTYVIWAYIKLARDPDYSALVDKWEKQKKINDFL